MKKLLLTLAGCVSLAGCADTQTIYVPTPVTCKVQDVAAPTFPTSKLVVSDSLFNKVKALIVENDLRKSYEMKLSAANKACQ